MSLLEHLRSSSRATTPAKPAPTPPPEPPVVAAPPPVPDAAPRVRSAVRNNEAHLELKTRVHEELIHELDPAQLVGDLSFTSPARRAVEQAAEERIALADPSLGRQDRLRLASEIADEVLGLGPLEPLLRDPTITEVMVNAWDRVYFERKGIIHRADASFRDDSHVLNIIVTIEDPAELQVKHEDWVSLETRPPNIEGKGQVLQRDLVKNALRMRPDRIIVGECRGGEAFDMLQAMNTGHDGSLTTIHANSPRDALSRVENMVLMAVDLPMQAVREQVAAGINLVVQIARMLDGTRKVSHISEIVGSQGSMITLQDLFLFQHQGLGPEGNVQGMLQPTGLRPRFMERLAQPGEH